MNTDFDTNTICFGLNRQEDEVSLQKFIMLFAQPEFLKVLVPRMADDEITRLFEDLTRLMGKHFKENEYHALFLGRN